MILKFLHAVGLTNLSDADVDKYYETRTPSLSRTTISLGGMTRRANRIKRCLDLSLASVILIIVAPLFVIIALVIKVTSPGPVFFAQRRVGLNERNFSLYKFRTMVLEPTPKLAEPEQSDEATATVFTIRNDPRVTPIGRLLRKTSMDELPQLISVLAGDMSLVGPRPLPLNLYYYEMLDEGWRRGRTSVRPGIVSLWAVQGKTSVNFEEWKKLDAEYLDRWSLWLDIKILLKTILLALTGSSASLEWPRKRVADDTDVAHARAPGVVGWR